MRQAPRRRDCLLMACAAFVGPVARAQPAPTAVPADIASALPGAQWRGGTTMRYWGLHIYDIRLFSAAPIQGDGSGQALALDLTYARSLAGAQIARRSVDEMRRIGPFDETQATRWQAAMEKLFPDVRAQDRLTGIHRPGQGARFFFNGQDRGEVADPDFARLFFGIWLSPRTSEPRLREQLLGQAP